MKCPFCNIILEAHEDLVWMCPTKVADREDSHYQFQSKLEWHAEVIIMPPFWFKTHHDALATHVYKYPFYPNRRIQTQPDSSNKIMNIPKIDSSKLDFKKLKQLACRTKGLMK